VPLDPAPLDPVPRDPVPLDPAPLDPAPLDPAPLDPGRARRMLLADERGTLDRRGALLRDIADVVAAASDVATDDEHDPEGATIAYERARVAALVEQADAHLGEIRAALERLAAGRYGTCERCGQPIGADRLDARPVARACIDCAGRTRP
jgi:RNA polymerase-binding protein DksA